MNDVKVEEAEDEKPLDPVLEKVRRKMLRLMFVSIGIMFAGVMAVLVAIVYKTNELPKENHQSQSASITVNDAPISATARLPEGFKVENTALSGNQVLFFGAMPDGTRKAFIFDVPSSKIVADITVTGNK